MSQLNGQHPAFEFVVDEPPGLQHPLATQLLQQDLQQWTFPRPRSVQNNVPSPTASVRSTRTASSQKRFERANFPQIDLSQSGGDLIDANTFELSPYVTSVHVPQDHYSNNAQGYHADAWNPYNMRSGDSSHNPSRLTPMNMRVKDCRSGPGSVGSYAPRSDSGYQTQSVLSNEPGLPAQDLPHGVTSQISQLQVGLRGRDEPDVAHMLSDQRSQVSSRNGNKIKSLLCEKCGEISKCKSDFKCAPQPLFKLMMC